jgi:parallel beta-helix repeat protein
VTGNATNSAGGNITRVSGGNSPGSGIRVWDRKYVNVSDCSLTNLGSIGVNVYSSSPLTSIRNVTLEKCKSAIYFQGGDYSVVSKCRIANSTDTAGTEPQGVYVLSTNFVRVINSTLSGSRTGVSVWGSTGVYIANNTINNTYLSSSNAGSSVYLYSSTNGFVRNNRLNNGTFGLYFSASIRNNASQNRITKADSGIEMTDDSRYNRVYGNYIYSNTVKNINDYDTSTNSENLYNESYAYSAGNYWGDYSGTDSFHGAYPQSQPGADGIGDSPYTIKASSPAILDFYPLMRLPDSTPPNSTVHAMPFWQRNPVLLVPFETWDNSWLRECGLMYEYSTQNSSWGGWIYYGKNATTGIHDRGNFTFTPPSGDGYYRLRFNATDFAWNNETGGDLPTTGDATICFDTTSPESNAYGFNTTSMTSTFDVPYNRSDALSGVKTIELWMASSSNGASWSGYTLYAKKNAPTFTGFSFSGSPGQFYRFYTRANDTAGNYEPAPVQNDTWTYIYNPDMTAPHSTITVKSPSFGTNPVNVTTATLFNLTATDAGSGVKFIWYNITNGTTSTYHVYAAEFTAPTWASKIQFGARDNAGNNETLHTLNISVDWQVPWTSINVGSPNYGGALKYVRPSTLFTLNSIDNHSGVASKWYRIDTGAWTKYTSPFTVSASGWHNLSYNATDFFGQKENPRVLPIFVDDSSSVTTIAVGDPHSGTSPYNVNSSTMFTLASTDGWGSGVKSVWYRVDLGSLVKYTSSFKVTTAGSHKIYFNATDNLGINEPTKNISIFVDLDKPVTQFIVGNPSSGSAPVYVKSATQFNLSASDAHLGIKHIMYRVDLGVWVKYAGNFTIPVSGAHNVSYNATDIVGNAENTQKLYIFVDDDTPASTMTVGSPKHGITPLYVNSSTGFCLAASDGGSGVASISYRVDSGSWTTFLGNFSVTTPSFHNISYRASDRLGNTEAPKTRFIFVDPDPPKSDIAAGAPNYGTSPVYVNSSTLFTISGDDGFGSGTAFSWFRVDSGNWTLYSGGFKIMSNGSHAVQYCSIDYIGNNETPRTLSIVVDNTPPATSYGFGSPKSGTDPVYVTPSTDINLTSADNGAGPASIGYCIDSGSWTLYGGNFTATTPGAHTVYYNATDNLGNPEQQKHFHIFVDITPPSTTVLVIGPKYGASPVYVVSYSQFNITPSDGSGSGAGSIMYKLDSSPSWTKYTGNITISTEGAHALSFYATDRLGNAEPAKLLNVSVDETAPVLVPSIGEPKFGSSPVYIRSSTGLTASASDAGSGLSSVQFRLDGGEWSAYSSQFALADLGAPTGSHLVEFRAMDNLGNWNIEKLNLFADDKPPVTSLNIGDPKAGTAPVYVRSSTKLNLTSLDSASGTASIWYRIDNESWVFYKLEFTIPLTGAHTLRYNATDNLGNAENIRTRQFFVDDIAPTVTITPSPDSSDTIHIKAGELLTIAWNDTGADDVRVFYKLDADTTWSQYTGPIDVSSSGSITYYGEDMLGNRAPDPQKTLKIVIVSENTGSNFIQDNLLPIGAFAGVLAVIVLILIFMLAGRRKKKKTVPKEKVQTSEDDDEKEPEEGIKAKTDAKEKVQTKKDGNKKESEDVDEKAKDDTKKATGGSAVGKTKTSAPAMKTTGEKPPGESMVELENIKDRTDELDMEIDKELEELENMLDKKKIKPN